MPQNSSRLVSTVTLVCTVLPCKYCTWLPHLVGAINTVALDACCLYAHLFLPSFVCPSVKLTCHHQLLTGTKSEQVACVALSNGASVSVGLSACCLDIASRVNGAALQAAASELMVAEAEKAKWQSSIDEVRAYLQHNHGSWHEFCGFLLLSMAKTDAHIVLACPEVVWH